MVIITHDHLDHNADAKVIASLLYDFNNYNLRKTKIFKDVFELEEIQEHTITWIVDKHTKKLLDNDVKNIIYLGDFVGGEQSLLENEDIQLSAIRTKHIRDSTETYGIKFYMKYNTLLTFGYTSDTAYFPELSDFFEGTDILLFNVSDIYRKDVKGIQDKRSHLGYNGSLKLLQAVKPKLAIASEFCCMNGDFRTEFVNVISEEIAKVHELSIIPGEIGLNVFLPKIQVECSLCKKLADRKGLKVLVPKKEYGKIQYVCRHCVKDVIY